MRIDTEEHPDGSESYWYSLCGDDNTAWISFACDKQPVNQISSGQDGGMQFVRISLEDVAAEKMTEEHMDEAVRRMKKELNCEFNDYAIYVDSEGAVSRYVVLLEPDHPIPVDAEGIYGEIMGRLFGEVNPEYGILTKLGSLGRPLVLIQQPQTHALWRDLMLMKGVSRNQIKPVRVLDTPMKQRFFFELLEEGQPLPKLPFSKQK